MEYYIINNASRASHYGIGTYVQQLVNVLKSQDGINIYSVELYADVNNFEVIESDDGVTHLQFPSCRSGMESESYCRSVCCLLSNYISRCARHTIFHFNYFQHYPLALAIKSKFPQARIILAVHYFGWCFSLKGNVTKFRETIKDVKETSENDKLRREYERERAFLCLADLVVALSEFAKNLIISDYKISSTKIRIVYNGLDNNSCKKNQYLLHKGYRRIILFVGRLDEIKGVPYLVKAFCKFASEYRDLQLYVVGDGNYDSIFALCHEIIGRVIFTGRLSKDDLCQLYDKTLFGVLPSFHEQCSYSAIEFMMKGIPFIGTDSTGLREMLSEMTQLTVHINETDFSEESFIQELAEKMEAMIKDSDFRQVASYRLFDLYNSRYTIDEMSNGMLSIVKRIKELPILSDDFLTIIDKRMIDLINSRPNVDLEFYGMTGIGVYLWWRVSSTNTEDRSYLHILEDALANYFGWLYDTIITYKEAICCAELNGMLLSMSNIKRYASMAHNILTSFSIVRDAIIPDEKETIFNALRIITTKI